MTRRRWLADEVSGSRAFLLGSHAEHLARVLRARVGQEFEIATTEGVHSARIIGVEPERVEFELGQKVDTSMPLPLTVLMSIFKFERLEWAIEKCTELGVARIVPMIARRTEKHLAAAATKRVERWRRISREASEQSRRSSPPDISEPISLKDGVALAAGTRIVLDESEHTVLLNDLLRQGSAAGDLIFAFGPEGGWTDEESKLFRESGWIAASLGSTILRAETAVIATIAIAASELQ
jgi:16S rRNA (uracil1498-N3)-methyltransferase